MHLYKVIWTWHEYYGSAHYDTREQEEYILGNARLGKTIYQRMHYDEIPTRIVQLDCNAHNFIKCLQHYQSFARLAY